MLAVKNFFSFAEIPDPALHRAYNEWHQLDHRPENLMLDGVIWGERWVRTPDCMEASTAGDERFERFHYTNLYWFRGPADQSVKEWQDLGARSFQWGRRQELRFVVRPYTGFFIPIKGYVNPRVQVSADVLPARPNLGMHLTISEFRGKDPDLDETFHWYDEVRIPDLLGCRGAAGAWTFVSDDTFVSHTVAGEGASLRFQVVWLDGDPIDYVNDVDANRPAWSSAGRDRDTSAVENVLFSGPLRVIIPWQWDWFD
jgi:hypothetical protein